MSNPCSGNSNDFSQTESTAKGSLGGNFPGGKFRNTVLHLNKGGLTPTDLHHTICMTLIRF